MKEREVPSDMISIIMISIALCFVLLTIIEICITPATEPSSSMLKHRFIHSFAAFLTLISTIFAWIHFSDSGYHIIYDIFLIEYIIIK